MFHFSVLNTLYTSAFGICYIDRKIMEAGNDGQSFSNTSNCAQKVLCSFPDVVLQQLDLHVQGINPLIEDILEKAQLNTSFS